MPTPKPHRTRRWSKPTILTLILTLVISQIAYAAVGDFILKWGSRGSGNGEFHYPWGMAVNSSGNVFVADFFNYRIQVFDSSGTFLRTWGSWGSADGEFKYPADVAVDSAGNIYVADGNNHRIQVFDSSGS